MLQNSLDTNFGLISTGDLTSMGLGYTLGALPIGQFLNSFISLFYYLFHQFIYLFHFIDPRPNALSSLSTTEFPKRECIISYFYFIFFQFLFLL